MTVTDQVATAVLVRDRYVGVAVPMRGTATTTLAITRSGDTQTCQCMLSAIVWLRVQAGNPEVLEPIESVSSFAVSIGGRYAGTLYRTSDGIRTYNAQGQTNLCSSRVAAEQWLWDTMQKNTPKTAWKGM